MKKLICASAIACLTLPALAQAHDKDKKVSDENVVVHDISGFDRLKVEGVYDLHVTIGDEFFVQTSGRDKDVKRMDVRVQGDTLILDLKDEKKKWGRNNNTKGIDLVMTVPSLRDIHVTGVVTGDIDGLDEAEMDVVIEGVSDLSLSGTCGALDADVQGVGELDARELRCEDVNVDLQGVGSVSVYASQSVRADADGVGSIDVYGKPETVKKSKGFLNSVKIH